MIKTLDKILVSHGTCSGHIAEVYAIHSKTFSARCECGWKFSGMRTDGYTKVTQ